MKSTPRRSYNQTARAESAADTRRRIIDVARELLAEAPLRNVGLPEIAAAAGVARSTVYTAFGSREGLLLAVAEDLLAGGGFDRLGRAFRHPDAVSALELSLEEAGRLYSAEVRVGWALLSLAAVDRDAASAAARLNRGRREGMVHLAQRLEDQGALRDDVTVAMAADVLWVITSFETFHQLHHDRGLSATAVTARLVMMAKRALIKGADSIDARSIEAAPVASASVSPRVPRGSRPPGGG